MLRYSSTQLGTITIVQKNQGEEKPRKFKIDIRLGNCLAVFLYVYKEKEPEDPKRPYVHRLVSFLHDKKHLDNLFRHYKKNVFAILLNADKIDKVSLNLFHKDSQTLLKYMIRDGLKVECYYKEEKQ